MRSPRSASRELVCLRLVGRSTVAPGLSSSLMEIPPGVLDTRGCSAAAPRSLSERPGLPAIMQTPDRRAGTEPLPEHSQTGLRDLHVLCVVAAADSDRTHNGVLHLDRKAPSEPHHTFQAT